MTDLEQAWRDAVRSGGATVVAGGCTAIDWPNAVLTDEQLAAHRQEPPAGYVYVPHQACWVHPEVFAAQRLKEQQP